ncbi:hypothetical protein HOY82DRAFT_12625 [Tuber indicum]|nr:hypothetical protein HOY82DRAFT_12625 [Tuber indicum]
MLTLSWFVNFLLLLNHLRGIWTCGRYQYCIMHIMAPKARIIYQEPSAICTVLGVRGVEFSIIRLDVYRIFPVYHSVRNGPVTSTRKRRAEVS